jgi:glycosyltransferase involved in cell wall biosynthesis
MTRPLVSVVIPTHERVRFLTQTLATALWQSGVDVEVVVVDDGSQPGLVARVPGIADPRVSVLRNDVAQGVSAARNLGIASANGEWIAFLDDDDLWAPTKLSEELTAADHAGASWAYAGVVKIDERNSIIGGSPPPDPAEVARRLLSWNLVPGGCSGVVVRRAVLDTAGGFDVRLVNLADWDLWIRLGSTGPPACAPQPLVAYRFHRRQASLDVAMTLAEADLLDGRDGTRVDRGALHHYLAHRSLVAGDRRRALTHLARAAACGQGASVAVDVSGRVIQRMRRIAPVRTSRPRRVPNWGRDSSMWLQELDDLVLASASERPVDQ